MPITATLSRRLLEELRALTMKSRLEELGVLRSFSSPRVAVGDRSEIFCPVKRKCPDLILDRK